VGALLAAYGSGAVASAAGGTLPYSLHSTGGVDARRPEHRPGRVPSISSGLVWAVHGCGHISHRPRTVRRPSHAAGMMAGTSSLSSSYDRPRTERAYARPGTAGETHLSPAQRLLRAVEPAHSHHLSVARPPLDLVHPPDVVELALLRRLHVHRVMCCIRHAPVRLVSSPVTRSASDGITCAFDRAVALAPAVRRVRRCVGGEQGSLSVDGGCACPAAEALPAGGVVMRAGAGLAVARLILSFPTKKCDSVASRLGLWGAMRQGVAYT
jgi:hypothetical protein